MMPHLEMISPLKYLIGHRKLGAALPNIDVHVKGGMNYAYFSASNDV